MDNYCQRCYFGDICSSKDMDYCDAYYPLCDSFDLDIPDAQVADNKYEFYHEWFSYLEEFYN